ncbi:RNA methyltransferase [Mycetohabitans sp. B8]|uniref:TrmH family RNA methyltransferase n=1 Tax=Mycetohabitans sp. B8 TaxID=2841845 RepID=UPI001F2ED162|nr:RNA methyltransferase [Mycetohabitans sp. B8]MCG1042333.1 RNA methyltransferase [Mycetohabitans sp. B8]
MKTITSRDNPLFKHLKALTVPAQQRKRGQALFEGLHLAEAYLDSVGQPVHCVLTESALAQVQTAQIVARLDPSRLVRFSDALFSQLSTLVNGIGIAFVVDVRPRPLPERVETTCVVLDGVQDAGNVGSILRSAAAAGIGDVFCSPGTAHAWSPKVLRAGMGAQFLLRVHEQVEAADVLARLAVPVFVTDSHDAQALYDVDLSGPLAWVFGNEGAGVSAEWRAAVGRRVTIPQPGGMESLNVAAAAAVCFFEQCRQRRVA